MLYFAYGSNMKLDHLADWLARCGIPVATPEYYGRGILHGYRFRTNYLRTSGAGAANIEPSDGGQVEGLLIRISVDIQQALRVKEGHPVRYREIDVEVEDTDAEVVTAMTYAVSPEYRLADDQLVMKRYRNLILDGAATAELSEGYQAVLNQVLRTR